MQSQSFAARRLSLPIWILLVITLLPVTLWFIRRLDDGSDEPLGLLALALGLMLAWRDRHSLHADTRARTIASLVLLASVATIGTLPPMLRAVMAVAGVATWFGLHRKPGITGLLVLSLPIIASLQFYAGYPLRLAAAEGSVRILDAAGLIVSRKGVGIELGGMTIGVDPACGGIRMLWHAFAAAMALAAINRTSWRATIAGGILALLLVVPANVVRATWLVLAESGRFHFAMPGHGEIGLICFCGVLIPLAWWLSKHARPGEIICICPPPHIGHRMILCLSALLAPLLMIRSTLEVTPPVAATTPVSFTFNGLTLPLSPLPSSASEMAFAKSFPGSISIHRWGDDQVILRQVTMATRRLHPSHDCLRAAGYKTTDSVVVRSNDGSEWSRFTATLGDVSLIIHERILSEQDGSSWTDVPSWYWAAVRHPLNGPWRAETLISRVDRNLTDVAIFHQPSD